MKKVSSSATYSEFRKKIQSVKEPAVKEANICQIDELTKQLEALNSRKKINSNKYDHPNGIIEEEQEDDTFAFNVATKNKAQNAPNRKLKVLTAKIEPTSTKIEASKLNKSIQGTIMQKKEKQTVSSKEINLKNSVKLPKKDEKDPKMMRRMSLTTLGKSSFISTNQSVNTSISQSDNQAPLMRKKQIIDKLGQIQGKLAKKSIPVHFFQQIMEKIEKIDQILEDC